MRGRSFSAAFVSPSSMADRSRVTSLMIPVPLDATGLVLLDRLAIVLHLQVVPQVVAQQALHFTQADDHVRLGANHKRPSTFLGMGQEERRRRAAEDE